LIHAYCGGIAKLRLEVEDARAALDAERKAHEETREHLRLTKHAFDVQCDLTDKAADAIRAERARREEAERERCERWQEKLSPLLARVATLEFRAAQLQGSLGAIRECCARCDDPAVTIAHIGSLAHAALAPAPTSSTPPPATKTSETLPMCGAPSCDNRADPRWFIHVNGHPIPACDGHGCGSLHPCAGCQQPPRADGGGK
jgi:hypothetical protein